MPIFYLRIIKKNFLDRKQTRLINPTKNELGFVSKELIQRITSRLLSSHKYNLWKNSMDTIDWFRKIRDKKRSTFVQFDIIEFVEKKNSRRAILKVQAAIGVAKNNCSLNDPPNKVW